MFEKIFLQCFLISLVSSASQHPILIVVSYDAFKYDFFDTKAIPNMKRLRSQGTYADYLINMFPTKTFVNHHSIATGMYPETHGIIGNSYFDPTSNKVVNICEEMFHYNNEIIPIWRRNEDAGDGRYSGSMMWPGGEYLYQGKNITYSKNFELGFDWHKRIDMVIDWLTNPQKPANLVMIYFEEPDTDAHKYGIGSNIVDNIIRKLDNITLYLEQQLKTNNLQQKANVIHLSDHGMLDVKPPNFINITQYLTPDTYNYAGTTPVLQFIPKRGFENEVYMKLKNASLQNGYFKVYKKDEYLDRWHYKNNPRSPPILAIADVGYGLDDLILAVEKHTNKWQINVTNESTFGVHGYDYTETEMRPFFMARGPKIKTNHKVPPFSSVDLYNLFCKILDITPTTNNGTQANIADVLVSGSGKYTLSTILLITAGGIIIATAFIGCAALITLVMIKRQQSITTTAALNKRFPQTFQTSIEAQHLLEPEDA